MRIREMLRMRRHFVGQEGGELIVTLIDHGIAFDPTLRKDPDIIYLPKTVQSEGWVFS